MASVFGILACHSQNPKSCNIDNNFALAVTANVKVRPVLIDINNLKNSTKYSTFLLTALTRHFGFCGSDFRECSSESDEHVLLMFLDSFFMPICAGPSKHIVS